MTVIKDVAVVAEKEVLTERVTPPEGGMGVTGEVSAKQLVVSVAAKTIEVCLIDFCGPKCDGRASIYSVLLLRAISKTTSAACRTVHLGKRSSDKRLG